VSGSIDSGEKDVYDDINITPMLDLAYVLMVIFIIMTTASVQGIKVNLPKASDTPSLAKPQTKAITLTADGTILGHLPGQSPGTRESTAQRQGGQSEPAGGRQGRFHDRVSARDRRTRRRWTARDQSTWVSDPAAQ
jgi:Biopolymer transport protein ExbD/TolR